MRRLGFGERNLVPSKIIVFSGIQSSVNSVRDIRAGDG